MAHPRHTQHTIFSTVSTQLIGEREALLFNDRHLEVEHIMRNFEEDSTLDHLCLNRQEALNLYRFLDKNHTFLEQ